MLSIGLKLYTVRSDLTIYFIIVCDSIGLKGPAIILQLVE